MTIEKKVFVDQIQIIEFDVVQVRTKTVILEDGKELSASYHRNSIAPGLDYSQEDKKVQDICALVHTPESIAAYEAMIEAARPKVEA